MTDVLVTGATSMLGRAVATALIERGDAVTVTQRHAAGLPCRQVLGDIADEDTVRRATAGQQAIVHLAAKVDVNGRWPEFERVNVRGTQLLLRAATARGAARFVHISSPAVAHRGAPVVGAAAEPARPGDARGHYARSKARAEQLVLAETGSVAVLALRPHLVWGPGDTQLVARIVARARAHRLALVGTGAALIDSTYVTNAVDAIVAGLDRCEVLSGQALVVTNGEPRPLSEIVARVCRAAGVTATTPRIPYRVAAAAGIVVDGLWAATRPASGRVEPPLTRFLVEQLATAHWFDQQHTRAALGWKPAVSLERGFELLEEHYRGLATPGRQPG